MRFVYPHVAPPLVLFGIPVLALVVVVLFVVALRRAGVGLAAAVGATAAWVAAFGVAAASGILSRADLRPPPMALMIVAIISGALLFGLSRFGERVALTVPLWALVGVHAFRLPLELVMHQASIAGVMPTQLTFGDGGFNYDIVTGTTAIVVAGLIAIGRAPRALVIGWNVMGLGFLVVIAGIAIATAPFVRAFGPGSVNTWVTYVPFVWLPGVLVPAAIAGHVVALRGAMSARTRASRR
ncbi:MAG: hypothetical protein HOV80_15950 [Polyangiaceae bacterium]|nr:hypothetical protein [Polyangiaceae bacterium]